MLSPVCNPEHRHNFLAVLLHPYGHTCSLYGPVSPAALISGLGQGTQEMQVSTFAGDMLRKSQCFWLALGLLHPAGQHSAWFPFCAEMGCVSAALIRGKFIIRVQRRWTQRCWGTMSKAWSADVSHAGMALDLGQGFCWGAGVESAPNPAFPVVCSCLAAAAH